MSEDQRDLRDRLIDALLEEALGPASGDLTDAVLRRADRHRWIRRLTPLAAAAAMFLVVAGAWMVSAVSDWGQGRRGAQLQSTTTPVERRLVLGGYCSLVLDAGARVQIVRRDDPVEVVLESGGLLGEVRAGVGDLAVRWRQGRLLTRDARFSAELAGAPGEPNQFLRVSVEQGFVQVESAGQSVELPAGVARLFPSPGTEERFGQSYDPAGAELQGFSGVVRGRLVSRSLGDRRVVVEVDEVSRIWPSSTASQPQSARGMLLLCEVAGSVLELRQPDLLETLVPGMDVEVEIDVNGSVARVGEWFIIRS